MNNFYLHQMTGPSALQGRRPALLESWRLRRRWMWAAKWNVWWSWKPNLFLNLRSRIWPTLQESKLGNKELFTVIKSWDDMVTDGYSGSLHRARNKGTQSLRVLETTILPPSGCSLRFSARAHFTSERKWRRWRLKRGILNVWKDPGKRFVL